MDKMRMASADITSNNIEIIGELFGSCYPFQRFLPENSCILFSHNDLRKNDKSEKPSASKNAADFS